MDSTLLGVTLLSMTMAAALSVIVWRMLRVERRRSDARVMALAELAAHEPPVLVAPHPPRVAPREETPRRERAQVPAARAVPQPSPDLALRDAPVAAPTIFAEREPSLSPWGKRFAVMSGLGLAVAAIVLFGLTERERSTGSASHQLVRPRRGHVFRGSPDSSCCRCTIRRQPGTADHHRPRAESTRWCDADAGYGHRVCFRRKRRVPRERPRAARRHRRSRPATNLRSWSRCR